MKARVKGTNHIIDVEFSHYVGDTARYITIYQTQYSEEDLEFIDERTDYWTRLEHQYAGMAMQGILSNPNIAYKDISNEILCNHWANNAIAIARALVEKMKEERK